MDSAPVLSKILRQQCVLQKNLNANQNKDDTAKDLGLALEQGAEGFAQIGADQRKQQGDQSDDGACPEDIDLKQRKADADCQCVNAGGNGLGQDGAEGKGGLTLLLLGVGASQTILPPIRASRTKATQWSMDEMNSAKVFPRK